MFYLLRTTLLISNSRGYQVTDPKKSEKNTSRRNSNRRRIHARSLPGGYLGFIVRPNNQSYEFEPDPTDKGSRPTKEFDPKK